MLPKNPYRRALGIISIIFFTIGILLFLISITGFSTISSTNPIASLTTATNATIIFTLSIMATSAGAIIGIIWIAIAALNYQNPPMIYHQPPEQIENYLPKNELKAPPLKY